MESERRICWHYSRSVITAVVEYPMRCVDSTMVIDSQQQQVGATLRDLILPKTKLPGYRT